MLPCMNEDLASSLRKLGYLTLHQLLDLPKTTLQNLIGNVAASKLTQVWNVLHDISICFYIYFFWMVSKVLNVSVLV